MDPFFSEITAEAASNTNKVIENDSANKQIIQEVVPKILIG